MQILLYAIYFLINYITKRHLKVWIFLTSCRILGEFRKPYCTRWYLYLKRCYFLARKRSTPTLINKEEARDKAINKCCVCMKSFNNNCLVCYIHYDYVKFQRCAQIISPASIWHLCLIIFKSVLTNATSASQWPLGECIFLIIP